MEGGQSQSVVGSTHAAKESNAEQSPRTYGQRDEGTSTLPYHCPCRPCDQVLCCSAPLHRHPVATCLPFLAVLKRTPDVHTTGGGVALGSCSRAPVDTHLPGCGEASRSEQEGATSPDSNSPSPGQRCAATVGSRSRALSLTHSMQQEDAAHAARAVVHSAGGREAAAPDGQAWCVGVVPARASQR